MYTPDHRERKSCLLSIMLAYIEFPSMCKIMGLLQTVKERKHFITQICIVLAAWVKSSV